MAELEPSRSQSSRIPLGGGPWQSRHCRQLDPVELHDGLLTPIGNVHERLRQARERHPVMLGNAFTEATSETIGDQMVTVLGYDECHRVLTDPDTYSSSIYSQIMGPIMGRTLLELEGAEHRISRALVSPSFRAKLLERWRSELVSVVVNELIDRFAARGRAELVREFTFVFPVEVIARVMGLPKEDCARFQRLSIALLNVLYDWENGIAASASLKEYFGEVLAERRREPRRRLDQHARAIGDRRHTADRRRNLRVPATDPARRVRDDLPRHRQPAGGPAD